jgi:hypothetical protein
MHRPFPFRRPITVLAFVLCAASASAAPRHVVVNGQRVTPQQLARLDAAQCTTIPNGYYWLDARTGAWGYAGNPVRQGWVGDGCGARQRSLSERRRLFRPGELSGVEVIGR